jgi:hypothetical protein
MHQLAKGHGLPLAMICTTGQDGDSPILIPLVDQLRAEHLGPTRGADR